MLLSTDMPIILPRVNRVLFTLGATSKYIFGFEYLGYHIAQILSACYFGVLRGFWHRNCIVKIF